MMNDLRPVTPRRRRKQRGGAMVESALVFTTLIGMIISAVDFGRILVTEQYLSERARVTVRMAVVNNWTSTQVASYAAYADITTGTNATSTVPGFLGVTPAQVRFTQYADSGIGDARYEVRITGMPMFTWIPSIAGRFTAPTVVATAPVQSLGASN